MVKTVLKIDGMMCPMCEAHVNDAIRRDFKVKKVTSSHKEKTTEILSDGALDRDQLQATVSGMGYTLLDVCTEPYEKKGLFSGLKK
ncbi:MAG: hypothetical protein E7643_08005 [Ruminococcaceae bacterium]|nr:hypothetical protein [Oscillospiraceae bacterium]